MTQEKAEPIATPITFRVYGLDAPALGEAAIEWLLQEGCAPHTVSVASSFRTDGVVDAVIFTAMSRQLVLRIARRAKDQADRRVEMHAGLSSLLYSRRMHHKDGTAQIRLVSFHAALSVSITSAASDWITFATRLTRVSDQSTTVTGASHIRCHWRGRLAPRSLRSLQ